jgi:hypothetical protein
VELNQSRPRNRDKMKISGNNKNNNLYVKPTSTDTAHFTVSHEEVQG